MRKLNANMVPDKPDGSPGLIRMEKRSGTPLSDITTLAAHLAARLAHPGILVRGGPELIKGKKPSFFFSEEARRGNHLSYRLIHCSTAALRQGMLSSGRLYPVPTATPCSRNSAGGWSLPAANQEPLWRRRSMQDIYNKLPLPSDAAGNLFFPDPRVF